MPHDVIIAGTGNAALCAALAARERGASVLVLEKAPESQRGGNSFFTTGGFRFAHQGLEDRPIRGLYAAGELVGGLFDHNYPGWAGLMAGSVFGKAAGESAAAIGAKAT